jgi:hypothetical protein
MKPLSMRQYQAYGSKWLQIYVTSVGCSVICFIGIYIILNYTQIVVASLGSMIIGYWVLGRMFFTRLDATSAKAHNMQYFGALCMIFLLAYILAKSESFLFIEGLKGIFAGILKSTTLH